MAAKINTTYNSVYLSFRPVIIMCQVLGFCPVKNTFKQTAKGLQFHILSIHVILALFFHFGISHFMIETLEFRHQSWPVTYFYNYRKWCFFVALFTTEKERIFIFKELEKFDEDILKLNKIKLIDYNPRLRGKVWFFIYKLVYGIGTDLVSYTIFYPKGKTALGLLADLIVKTFSAQMVFSYTIMYLTFSHEICYRFYLLEKSWIHHLFNSSKVSGTQKSQESIRQLHSHLTSIADKLSESFGPFFVVNLFFVFFEVLMYFYRILHTNINIFSNVQSVVFLAMNVASVPILASSTYYLLIAVSIHQ
uniref:Uncharacterized protein n=3 Tax=Clastoptera arizonana TaxID=38151 RepID=A0A1B6CI84_9HEMI